MHPIQPVNNVAYSSPNPLAVQLQGEKIKAVQFSERCEISISGPRYNSKTSMQTLLFFNGPFVKYQEQGRESGGFTRSITGTDLHIIERSYTKHSLEEVANMQYNHTSSSRAYTILANVSSHCYYREGVEEPENHYLQVQKQPLAINHQVLELPCTTLTTTTSILSNYRLCTTTEHSRLQPPFK